MVARCMWHAHDDSVRKMQEMWTGVRPTWLCATLMQKVRISSSLRSLDVKIDLLSCLGLWPGDHCDPSVFQPYLVLSFLGGESMVLMTLVILEPVPRGSLFKNQ